MSREAAPPPPPGDVPPASAEEALGRAAEHARRSAAEAVLALRALLDAGALAARGTPAAGQRGLARAAELLSALAADLLPEGGAEASLLGAVAEALDVEIARWEERSRRDPDARPVLRAFLGIRELLWEFGVRSSAGAAGSPAPSGSAVRSQRSTPRRVQRVAVEGCPDEGTSLASPRGPK